MAIEVKKSCMLGAEAQFIPKEDKEPVILRLVFGNKPDDADADDSVRMKGDITIRVGSRGIISVFADRMDRIKPDFRVYGQKKENK